MADKGDEAPKKGPAPTTTTTSKSWYGTAGVVLGLLWRVYVAKTGSKDASNFAHPTKGKTPQVVVDTWEGGLENDMFANSLNQHYKKFQAIFDSVKHLDGVMDEIMRLVFTESWKPDDVKMACKVAQMIMERVIEVESGRENPSRLSLNRSKPALAPLPGSKRPSDWEKPRPTGSGRHSTRESAAKIGPVPQRSGPPSSGPSPQQSGAGPQQAKVVDQQAKVIDPRPRERPPPLHVAGGERRLVTPASQLDQQHQDALKMKLARAILKRDGMLDQIGGILTPELADIVLADEKEAKAASRQPARQPSPTPPRKSPAPPSASPSEDLSADLPYLVGPHPPSPKLSDGELRARQKAEQAEEEASWRDARKTKRGRRSLAGDYYGPPVSDEEEVRTDIVLVPFDTTRLGPFMSTPQWKTAERNPMPIGRPARSKMHEVAGRCDYGHCEEKDNLHRVENITRTVTTPRENIKGRIFAGASKYVFCKIHRPAMEKYLAKVMDHESSLPVMNTMERWPLEGKTFEERDERLAYKYLGVAATNRRHFEDHLAVLPVEVGNLKKVPPGARAKSRIPRINSIWWTHRNMTEDAHRVLRARVSTSPNKAQSKPAKGDAGKDKVERQEKPATPKPKTKDGEEKGQIPHSSPEPSPPPSPRERAKPERQAGARKRHRPKRSQKQRKATQRSERGEEKPSDKKPPSDKMMLEQKAERRKAAAEEVFRWLTRSFPHVEYDSRRLQNTAKFPRIKSGSAEPGLKAHTHWKERCENLEKPHLCLRIPRWSHLKTTGGGHDIEGPLGSRELFAMTFEQKARKLQLQLRKNPSRSEVREIMKEFKRIYKNGKDAFESIKVDFDDAKALEGDLEDLKFRADVERLPDDWVDPRKKVTKDKDVVKDVANVGSLAEAMKEARLEEQYRSPHEKTDSEDEGSEESDSSRPGKSKNESDSDEAPSDKREKKRKTQEQAVAKKRPAKPAESSKESEAQAEEPSQQRQLQPPTEKAGAEAGKKSEPSASTRSKRKGKRDDPAHPASSETEETGADGSSQASVSKKLRKQSKRPAPPTREELEEKEREGMIWLGLDPSVLEPPRGPDVQWADPYAKDTPRRGEEVFKQEIKNIILTAWPEVRLDRLELGEDLRPSMLRNIAINARLKIARDLRSQTGTRSTEHPVRKWVDWLTEHNSYYPPEDENRPEPVTEGDREAFFDQLLAGRQELDPEDPTFFEANTWPAFPANYRRELDALGTRQKGKGKRVLKPAEVKAPKQKHKDDNETRYRETGDGRKFTSRLTIIEIVI